MSRTEREQTGERTGQGKPTQRVFTAVVIGAVVMMAVSFAFTLSTSAHNINLARAREKAREYARLVRDDSDGLYTRYRTDCREFPAGGGHHHIVRCVIEFDDEVTIKSKSGKHVCRETLEINFSPHNRGVSYQMNLKHYSGNCETGD